MVVGFTLSVIKWQLHRQIPSASPTGITDQFITTQVSKFKLLHELHLIHHCSNSESGIIILEFSVPLQTTSEWQNNF